MAKTWARRGMHEHSSSGTVVSEKNRVRAFFSRMPVRQGPRTIFFKDACKARASYDILVLRRVLHVCVLSYTAGFDLEGWWMSATGVPYDPVSYFHHPHAQNFCKQQLVRPITSCIIPYQVHIICIYEVYGTWKNDGMLRVSSVYYTVRTFFQPWVTRRPSKEFSSRWRKIWLKKKRQQDVTIPCAYYTLYSSSTKE